MARALSCIRGLSYVDPAVVREVAVPVLAHRIIVQTQGTQPKPAEALIQDILQSQHTPQ
jgi:MoxR-like ATPase